jgi:hypothetical protein
MQGTSAQTPFLNALLIAEFYAVDKWSNAAYVNAKVI